MPFGHVRAHARPLARTAVALPPFVELLRPWYNINKIEYMYTLGMGFICCTYQCKHDVNFNTKCCYLSCTHFKCKQNFVISVALVSCVHKFCYLSCTCFMCTQICCLSCTCFMCTQNFVLSVALISCVYILLSQLHSYHVYVHMKVCMYT